MSHLSRRQWLKQTAAAAAAGVAVPYFVPRGVLAAADKPGANDRIRIGAIGVGGRATMLLDQLPETGQIAALCDCELPRAEKFKENRKSDWPVYQDFRKILERTDIDAVIVGTGDFQRVLPCVEACIAGKDVYAEKPLTLYIEEGRVLVKAVRKYNRILQVGSQQRSMAINRLICEFIRSGGLGKILEVRAVNYPGPKDSPVDLFPAKEIPPGLDWNMWLGQAAMRPYSDAWRGWMQWYDFCGSEMANWGAHGLDQAQWALGTDGTGPVEMGPVTDGEPGQLAMRFANGVPLNFNIEFLTKTEPKRHGPLGGCIVIGEKGKVEINRNKFTTSPKEIGEELLKKVDQADEEVKWSDQTAMWQAKWHLQNWLECIKSRQLPNADVEIGHRSISIAHLANITRKLNRQLKWDPAKEEFVGDEEANRLVSRPRRAGFELPAIA